MIGSPLFIKLTMIEKYIRLAALFQIMGLFGIGKNKEDEFLDLQEYNKQKLQIKVVTLNSYDDAKKAISSLTSNAVTVMNIRPLRLSNMVEVKRAIEELKRAVSVFEGDIAAFSQDTIVITPKNIEIFRKNKRDEMLPRPRPEDIIPSREEDW